MSMSKKYLLIPVLIFALAYASGYFAGSLAPQDGNFHRISYQKDFFEQAFNSINGTQPLSKTQKRNTKGIIVNHHLLASNLIAEALGLFATENSVTIVLASPNHFGAGNGYITTTDNSWDTPYGALRPDTDAISRLVKSGAVTLDDSPFKNEHGISNIVSFIKKAMPRARIVPLIFRDKTPDAAVDALAAEIKKTIRSPALAIASLDFSHYLPGNVADFHDAHSLAVIRSFDFDSVQSVEIDSKPALRFMLKYMQAQGAEKFSMLANTNSAKLTGDPTAPETTSYVTGYFSKGPMEKDPTITALYLEKNNSAKDKLDDAPFGRSNGLASPQLGLNEKTLRFLDGADIVITPTMLPLTTQIRGKTVTFIKSKNEKHIQELRKNADAVVVLPWRIQTGGIVLRDTEASLYYFPTADPLVREITKRYSETGIFYFTY